MLGTAESAGKMYTRNYFIMAGLRVSWIDGGANEINVLRGSQFVHIKLARWKAGAVEDGRGQTVRWS